MEKHITAREGKMFLEWMDMLPELDSQPPGAPIEHTPAEPTNLLLNNAFRSSLLAEAHAHRKLYELDPGLDGVLRQIANGWTPADLPRLVAGNDAGLVAFDDSWTLFAWSQWWTQQQSVDPSVEVVILHADDHRDLFSPLVARVPHCLVSRKDRWIDVLSGRWTSLSDVHSVKSAILSGAIGIGTFMVLLVHSLRRVEIRHLRFGSGQTVKSCIRRSTTMDPRLLPIAPRLSVQDHPIELADPNLASIYARTSDVQEWVERIPDNAKILLHIDLDYFNDSYAGGRVPGRPEPTEDEMQADIKMLCQALAANGLCRRIESTAIALSPGFCPSQCWEFILCHLSEQLRAIGCPCP